MTYEVDVCPVCQSKNIVEEKTTLAKFVAWRISGVLHKEDLPILSLKCNDCDFYGSKLRFTPEEENRLYNKYRGEEYNRMRVECEPEYDAIISVFDEKEYAKERSVGISYLIEKYVDVSKIQTLLDYGGDDGRHIPKILSNCKKYVYDISNIDPLDGINKLEQSNKIQSDFLMCCHTLEHISDLHFAMSNIKKFPRKGSFAYFEVPNTKSAISSLHVKRFHEHINFFNKSSFSVLLSNNGFDVIDVYEGKFLCILTKFQ